MPGADPLESHDCLATGEITDRLKAMALTLDFDLVGIARAVQPLGYHRLLEWIDRGFAADMDWIPRRRDAYAHPNNVLAETRSVVMVAMNYHNAGDASKAPRIARYAVGSEDYHTVVKKRLRKLGEWLHQYFPEARTRAVTDTAPLLERDFARLAGIGWFGKNTMLINPRLGSWFFLGALLTTAELSYDAPFETTHCGTCTRCLTACPTNAFPEPGVLDANRCISYLTIERREKDIPESLRSGLQDWVFGCDICQEVCPWNRFAPQESVAEFRPGSDRHELTLACLLSLDDAEFLRRFRGTPLERTGRAVLVRNAAIVAGNLQRRDLAPQLRILLNDGSPLVVHAAGWALRRLEQSAGETG